MEILCRAQSFALTECECRERYKRCDNPLDVCFVLGDAADKYLSEGRARRITIDEAKRILFKADEYGLVHLSIYNADQGVFAVCSC